MGEIKARFATVCGRAKKEAEDSSYNSVLYIQNQLNSRILYSDRNNSFQDIKEKKKRYVYFISENVGNFQTDTRDIIVVLTHIAWTTIATYASKVSYDLHLNVT